MYEITKNHEDALDYYISERIAYKNAVYDFTFENRYLIYHAPMRNRIVYIALDMKTRLSSEIYTKRGEIYTEYEYEKLIPKILFAIKYNGDMRYSNKTTESPEVLIDHIFREILPNYGYSVREEQIQLSKHMYNGLMNKKATICEAEVGTGKSMAYLIAAFSAKAMIGSCEPITITTSSIELQKALVEKEIPRLSAMLMEHKMIRRPLTVVLRKGKEHYFCPLRYKDYIDKININSEKHQEELNLFGGHFQPNKVLDLDKVMIPGYVKSKICVQGTCAECRYTKECKYNAFIKSAMSESVSLDFQVTNHNLYLMSAKYQGLLRNSTFVIVDEAHKLKEAAQSVYGEQLSESTIPKFLRWTSTQCIHKNDLEWYRCMRNEAYEANKKLFQHLRLLLPQAADMEDNNIISLDSECMSLIRQLFTSVGELDDMRTEIKGVSEVNSQRICNCLLRFLDSKRLNVWLEPDDGNLKLCCCSKKIGNELMKHAWNLPRRYVFTSGTMSDGVSFDFFKQANGLNYIPGMHMTEHSSPSPFDYTNNTRLYLPKDIPSPNNDSDEYVGAIADRIVRLVKATNGHTAVLFTSYKLLSKVYGLTKERLHKYEIIRMARNDRTAISQFKRSHNGVLFASGSMWEGVDCVGDCLSSVIIVRLPFPIRSATMNEKKAQSSSLQEFIHRYAVPEMLIKLRQGAGRLVRSETDTGVLSILDPRATYGSYAQKVQNALEKYPVVKSIDEVETFIKSVKSDDYFY